MNITYDRIVPFDPSDISNGFYPHLRKVGEADPEFLDVLGWLESKGAPGQLRLYADRGVSTDGSPSILPSQIEFTRGGQAVSLDAALVFNFPHVALVDLKNAFGFGNPNVLDYYPGIRREVAFIKRPSPIGEHWPEKGANAYRPADFDTLPIGVTWVDSTGSYLKVERGWWVVKYGVWIKQA